MLYKTQIRPLAWNTKRSVFGRVRTKRRGLVLSRMLFREFSFERFSGISWVENMGPGFSDIDNRAICWETPTGFTLWFDDQPSIAVGVEFSEGTLTIRQLQGVKGKKIPNEFQGWPLRMVQVLVRYARLTRMRRVRICRAHTSIFYKYPDFGMNVGDEYYKEREALRERLRLRYDGTARRAGFTKHADYYELDLT